MYNDNGIAINYWIIKVKNWFVEWQISNCGVEKFWVAKIALKFQKCWTYNVGKTPKRVTWSGFGIYWWAKIRQKQPFWR
jgi:hypothetical protein